MNADELAFLMFAGILLLIVLVIPVTGNVLGMPIKLPIVGWVALAAIAILAVVRSR